MSYFIKSGNSFSVTDEANIDIRKELPIGTYTVMFTLERGYFLEVKDDPEITHKLYGTVTKRAERIINTFADREGSTGVILQGEKGSGKTMLAKLLSHKLREQNVITLIVNAGYSGETFNTFMSGINQPALVIFDEFEKVYDKLGQDKLLTLLDGTHSTKKMYVIALNDFSLVNNYMKNRPGRFFYSFSYEGLEEEFVREYCEDNLKDKSKVQGVVDFASAFNKFNFDMLKAIVEEMNRYDEGVGEVVKYLNVKPTENWMALDVVEAAVEGDEEWKAYSKTLSVNPMSDFTLDFTKPEPAKAGFTKKLAAARAVSDDDDEYESETWKTVSFKPTDLVRMSNGRFVFKNEKASVTLQKKVVKKTDFSAMFG